MVFDEFVSKILQGYFRAGYRVQDIGYRIHGTGYRG